MDRLLNISEVAEVTRLSENTLRWLRHTGSGPRSGKLGRRLMYREQDVQTWIDQQFEATAPPQVSA